MSETKFTKGPWKLEEYEEFAGYDCMTGGIRVGPVMLDGRDYGQKRCHDISDDQRARMEADSRLIAAAPDLYEALERDERLFSAMCEILDADALLDHVSMAVIRERRDAARSALAKARGETT